VDCVVCVVGVGAPVVNADVLDVDVLASALVDVGVGVGVGVAVVDADALAAAVVDADALAAAVVDADALAAAVVDADAPAAAVVDADALAAAVVDVGVGVGVVGAGAIASNNDCLSAAVYHSSAPATDGTCTTITARVFWHTYVVLRKRTASAENTRFPSAV